MPTGSKHDPKESFEPIPMLAACLTYLGFYFLMLLGFLNQLLFAPKVATERNREVSHLSPCHWVFYFLSLSFSILPVSIWLSRIAFYASQHSIFYQTLVRLFRFFFASKFTKDKRFLSSHVNLFFAGLRSIVRQFWAILLAIRLSSHTRLLQSTDL